MFLQFDGIENTERFLQKLIPCSFQDIFQSGWISIPSRETQEYLDWINNLDANVYNKNEILEMVHCMKLLTK